MQIVHLFQSSNKSKRYANQHKKQPTKQWKNWGALKWPKIGTNSSIKCLKCINGFYIDDKDSNHSLRNSRSIFSRVSCFGRESPRAFETKAARSCCRSAASLLRASVEIMERESSATSNDFSIVVWMWPQKNARDIPPNTENLNLKMMGLGRWSSLSRGAQHQVPAVNLLWWVSGVFKLRTTCVQGYISCHRSGHLASMRISQQSCVQFDSKVHRKWHSFVHQNCSQLSHLLHESHPTVIAQSLPTSLARSRLSSSAGIPWGKGHPRSTSWFQKPSGMQGWLEDSTKGRTTNCLEACPKFWHGLAVSMVNSHFLGTALAS